MIYIYKTHTKNNDSPEDDQKHDWKRLGKYGTLSPPFGSQHTKRSKKTGTSKDENDKKKYSVVYNKAL